jgi:hypothetical protein
MLPSLDARERQLRYGAVGEIGQTRGCHSETDAGYKPDQWIGNERELL